MTPEMIPTPQSSNVEEIGYDAEAEEVLVRFKSGALYFYLGVPAVVWEDFVVVPSKGSFVNQVLKGYPFRRG